MRVTSDQTRAAVVYHVIGNLEHLTVGQFREEVARIQDNSRVIFDLSAVPFVDSAGLGALIGAVRRIRERHGDAVVCSARPSVGRVLEVVGLPRVVVVARNLDEAKARLLPAA
jgi:anti-anti-sigma factor